MQSKSGLWIDNTCFPQNWMVLVENSWKGFKEKMALGMIIKAVNTVIYQQVYET